MSFLISSVLDRLPIYKTYVYVEEGEVKERDFDFVRWLGRKIFGWYPETHHSNAIQEVFKRSLQPGFTNHFISSKELINKLFAKSIINTPESRLLPMTTLGEVSFGQGTIYNGSTLTLNGTYYFEKDTDDELTSLGFDVHIGVFDTAYIPLRFTKSKPNSLEMKLETNLSPDSPRFGLINALVRKILRDTSSELTVNLRVKEENTLYEDLGWERKSVYQDKSNKNWHVYSCKKEAKNTAIVNLLDEKLLPLCLDFALEKFKQSEPVN